MICFCGVIPSYCGIPKGYPMTKKTKVTAKAFKIDPKTLAQVVAFIKQYGIPALITLLQDYQNKN